MNVDNRFPELTRQQINLMKPFGTIKRFPKDKTIIRHGDKNFRFYVILQGKVRIENTNSHNNLVVVHTQHQFTGDSDMLSKRAAVFSAIIEEDSLLLEIEPDNLQRIITQYSGISDILLNTFLIRQEIFLNIFDGGFKLLSNGQSKPTYILRDFMTKNYIWHTWLDLTRDAEAKKIIESFQITEKDLPIVIDMDNKIHKNPTIKEMAEISGVLLEFTDQIYDLIVVGAGPGGLASSVYAASEGLQVLTIESSSPGGQAGKSSKIENYLGFPTGISGEALAKKAYLQAQKFGCHISIPHTVKKLTKYKSAYRVVLDDDTQVRCKSLIAATGADYSKPPIDNFEKYEGQGIYYSATEMNGVNCKGQEIGIIGGGNSAGQAVLFLSNYASKAHMFVRSGDLGSKMSDYLIQRIKSCSNIEVHLNTEVQKLYGDHTLDSIDVVNNISNETEVYTVQNLFTFIGAKPYSDWINDVVETDEQNFILTGDKIKAELEFKPQTLETSLPGVFAVGDVRNGSTKRVASAVGEGAMAVSQVHQFLSKKPY